MRKGTLVKLCLDPARPWADLPAVYRHTTHEEKERWRNSPASKGFNSAGETKLAPQIIAVNYEDGDTWTIVRARCAPIIHWRKQPKSVQIMNNRTNEVGYVRRVNVEVV